MYYTVSGAKWGDTDFGTESGVITWGSNLDSSLQFSGDYTSGDFDVALQDSFDTWEEISGLDFTFVSGGDADIDVAMGFGDGARYGTVGTASWSTSGGEITSGTLTFDEEEFWAPNGEGSGTVDFFAVALHEIGHLIGLDHYDPSPGDPAQIMNSSITTDTLQSGDIAGAQFIYGTGDGSAPPPPDEPGGDDPEPPEAAPPADDGGSSSAIGIVIALLGALVAMIFGAGGAAVGFAAGSVSRDDESDPESAEDAFVADGVLLTDLLPVVEDMSSSVYVDDFGNFVDFPEQNHEHGHDGGQCDGTGEDMLFA